MNNIVIHKSTNTDKRTIKRFYKKNHYPVSFMGHDHVYMVIFETNIIGCVIVSHINKGNSQGLLHALLISERYRSKGYAKLLIQKISKEHGHLICFADEKLKKFYASVDFQERPVDHIYEIFINKYKSYLNKNKNLKVFIYNI